MNIEFILLAVLTFLVSFASTIVGFGTGTVMVPILLIFLPLSQTYLLANILQWFSSLWKTSLFYQHVRWPLVIKFGIPAIVGSIAGALLLFQLPLAFLYRTLGMMIIAYVIFLYLNPTFRIKENVITTIIGGITLGFIGGLFGIRGLVRTVFLTAFRLSKESYIASAGAIGLIIDTTRFMVYLWGGMRLGSELSWSLLVLIPLSLIGAKGGEQVIRIIPTKLFRILVSVVLLIVGLKLLLYPGI